MILQTDTSLLRQTHSHRQAVVSSLLRWLVDGLLTGVDHVGHLPRRHRRHPVILAATALLFLLFWWQPEIIADVILTRAQAWAAFVTDVLEKQVRSTFLPGSV